MLCSFVRLSVYSMCIRQIQHDSVVRLCIKLIKYVHVNALRAAFCAAIIKFLIVAFYSHVSSGRMDIPTDRQTGWTCYLELFSSLSSANRAAARLLDSGSLDLSSLVTSFH